MRNHLAVYLKSRVMENGIVMKTEEGSPQGGNLSPLLADIYWAAAGSGILSRKRIEPIRFSREISGLYFGKNPYNIDILSRIFPSSILTDLYVKTACTLQRANFR